MRGRLRQRVGGFTLLEIIVTVGILGLAAALLVPYMGNIATFEAESAVRQIVADLSYAQSDAMARQARRRVLFHEDGSGYRILVDPFDPDNDVLYDPSMGSSDGRYIVNLAGDSRFGQVQIESVDFDGGNRFITYDELGGPIKPDGTGSIGGSIVVSSGEERFTIRVAPFTGRVYVESEE